MKDKLRFLEQNDRWYEYSKFNATRKNEFSGDKINFVLVSIAPQQYKPFNLGANIIDKVVNDSAYFCDRAVFFTGEVSQAWNTGKPIRSYDVIGISSYMVTQMFSVPSFLHANKINPLDIYREENDPIIVLGGQVWVYLNLYYKFIDVACMGEGEEFIIEVLDLVDKGRKAGLKRQEILNNIATLKGAFVPSVHNVDDTSEIITKRYVEADKLNQSLLTEDNMNSKYVRKVVEICRGCKYMCNFCRLSRSNYPFREFSVDDIERSILTFDKGSHIYPFAPDEGSFKYHDEVQKFALENDYKYYRYNFRVNTCTYEDIEKKNLSNRIVFGIDGISQRVINIVNKKINLEEFKNKAIKVFENRYGELKLNYVFSYPFETNEDYEELEEYWRWLIEKRMQIQGTDTKGATKIILAPTPFIPEPTTPMYYFKVNSNIDSRFKDTFDRLVESYFSQKIVPLFFIQGLQSKTGWLTEVILNRLDKDGADFIWYLYKNNYSSGMIKSDFLDYLYNWIYRNKMKISDLLAEKENQGIFDKIDWSGGKLNFKQLNRNLYTKMLSKINGN